MGIKDKLIVAGLAVASLCGLGMIKLYKDLYNQYQLKCAEARCWKTAAKATEIYNGILQDELNSQKETESK